MSYIKWTKETLEVEALKYSNRVDFRKSNQSAYDGARYRNILDEICSHMPKHLPRKWTKEELAKEVAKYSSKSDFRKGNKNAYYAVKNQGLLVELLGHFDDEKLKLANQFIPIPSKLQGIYILYKGDEITYVGKSTRCMMNRIYKHTSPTSVEVKPITKVVAYEINNSADLDVAEVYLINKYQPQYNTESNSGDKLTLVINNIDSIIDITYTINLKENKWHLQHSS